MSEKEELVKRLRDILMDRDGPASDATVTTGSDIPWGFDEDLDTVHVDGTIELPQFADELIADGWHWVDER